MALQSFYVVAVRPSDLLVLTLRFTDVDVTAPQPGVAGRITGQNGSYLTVFWQGQHVAEESFLAADGKPLEDPAPVGYVDARLAGESRLVFVIPPGTSFPYTLAGVLDALQTLPLSVHPVAMFDRIRAGCLELLANLSGSTTAPPLSKPTTHQTAIEVPYRILLSPDDFARWHHANTPITRNDNTEIWHSRLGTTRPDGDPRLRAIWSPDFSPTALQPHKEADPTTIPPFRYNPTTRQRNEIIHLNANYHLKNYVPAALKTEHLMLSTWGAWARFQGDWTLPEGDTLGLEIEQWRHDSVGGRDQVVRIVSAGYLLPFGLRASLVELTERKFYDNPDDEGNGLTAYLLKREFVMVREWYRVYYHRDMPFRSITVQPTVTPDMNRIGAGVPLPTDHENAFWIRVPTTTDPKAPFYFHITATDWEGDTTHFHLPMLFVRKSVHDNAATLAPVLAAYNAVKTDSDPANDSVTTASFKGQKIAYTPAHSLDDGGDSTLETATLTFGVRAQADKKLHPALFLPTMAQAGVQSPALQNLTGRQEIIPIVYENSYLAANEGIGNKGQIFARVVAGSSPKLEFTPNQSGGLVAPNFKISGISRAFGVVGDNVDKLKDGSYNPATVFKSLADVQLLGAISLGDILGKIDFANPSAPGLRIPRLTTRRVGDTLIAEYVWRAEEKNLQRNACFTPQSGAFLELKAVTERSLTDPTSAKSHIEGKLTNFTLTLLPETVGSNAVKLIALDVTSVAFLALPGKKPDVTVKLGKIEFFGMLQYVNVLSQLIPLGGFSDGPALEIVPPPDMGIKVGFSLGLPTVGLGIFTLQNISFAAALFLPFVGKPMNFRFAFCERWQPFILTVMGIGGSGFVGIELTPKGVELIEAALEFGVSLAVNLGVAAGEATIMGGVYFRKTGAGFELTAYFRLFGSLSVLAIVTVSVEVYIGLTFSSKQMRYPDRAVLYGQARVTLKIKILFFSTSVSLAMEREFAGSDPVFRQMVSLPQWAEYCDAFDDYA